MWKLETLGKNKTIFGLLFLGNFVCWHVVQLLTQWLTSSFNFSPQKVLVMTSIDLSIPMWSLSWTALFAVRRNASGNITRLIYEELSSIKDAMFLGLVNWTFFFKRRACLMKSGSILWKTAIASLSRVFELIDSMSELDVPKW